MIDCLTNIILLFDQNINQYINNLYCIRFSIFFKNSENPKIQNYTQITIRKFEFCITLVSITKLLFYLIKQSFLNQFKKIQTDFINIERFYQNRLLDLFIFKNHRPHLFENLRTFKLFYQIRYRKLFNIYFFYRNPPFSNISKFYLLNLHFFFILDQPIFHFSKKWSRFFETESTILKIYLNSYNILDNTRAHFSQKIRY